MKDSTYAHFTTTNVQGLHQLTKRINLLHHWSRRTTSDIIFLQETKSTGSTTASTWRDEAHTIGFDSTISAESEAAILWRTDSRHVQVDNSLPKNILAKTPSLQGRVVDVPFKSDHYSFRAASIYAPAQPTPRKAFFKALDEAFAQVESTTQWL